jgi:long-subunit acyl-CoA synthetase (AMP-forming)
MTESSPVTLFQPEEGVTPGSCGVPVPNTVAKVVDPDSGRALGPNEVNNDRPEGGVKDAPRSFFCVRTASSAWPAPRS